MPPVESVISFMTQSFPNILITESDAIADADALHDRADLNVINLNKRLFDDIERAQRQGEGFGHLLYHVFVTLIHELGHWFWSSVSDIPNYLLEVPYADFAVLI